MNISEIYHNALLAQAAYANDLNNYKADSALSARLLAQFQIEA